MFATVAPFSFSCPICDILVQIGSACCEDEEDNHYCINHLPAKRLIPKDQYDIKTQVNDRQRNS